MFFGRLTGTSAAAESQMMGMCVDWILSVLSACRHLLSPNLLRSLVHASGRCCGWSLPYQDPLREIRASVF